MWLHCIVCCHVLRVKNVFYICALHFWQCVPQERQEFIKKRQEISAKDFLTTGFRAKARPKHEDTFSLSKKKAEAPIVADPYDALTEQVKRMKWCVHWPALLAVVQDQSTT